MKKSQIIINTLLIISIIVGDVFYIINGDLLTKSLTSGAFVFLGLTNLIYTFKFNSPNKKFSIFIFIGLVFAMLGDIILELNFIIGALLFATGHVFFFISYCNLLKLQAKDFLTGAIIFIPFTLLILFAPIFDFGGILMQGVCIFYTIIISCMLGKAITNYIKDKNTLNLILLIGSALFTFSDVMLLFNVFANFGRIVGILCLTTYYPAEIFLGLSVAFQNKITN